MRFFGNSLLKFLLLLTIVVGSLLLSNHRAFAAEDQYITLVNPVRISRYNPNLSLSLKAQYQIIRERNLPATWLFTYDTLEDKEAIAFTKQMDSRQEKGVFLEVTEPYAKASGVKYNNSGFWHFSNSVFLSGYEQKDRNLLIDTVFEKFKSTYGFYPASVGAWWIDSYSLGYMKEKYGIIAHLGLADQFSTDGYQVWGQYWSTPFYPSMNHAGIPAADSNSKLDIVEFQWAPRDPLNGYKDSKYSTQDYPVMGLHTDYFQKLIEVFARKHNNKFGQITVGLESDLPPDNYFGEYENQMDLVKSSEKTGIKATNMSEFANWYRSKFPNISPVQIITSGNLLGGTDRVFWYNSPHYRVGILYNPDNKTKVIDFRTYQNDFQEPYFLLPNSEKSLSIYIPSVIDLASDEQLGDWELPLGGLIKTEHIDDTFKLIFEKDKEITFYPDKISINASNIKVPLNIRKEKAIIIRNNSHLTITPKNKWIAPTEGVIVKSLSPEARHFLSGRKTKLAIALGVFVICAVLFALSKLKIKKAIRVFAQFLLICLAILGATSLHTKNTKHYWISQAEVDTLSKLSALPPGRVVTVDQECLQCKSYSKIRPAAFINAREYVSRLSHKPVVSNSTIFTATTREIAKKELDKLKAKYIYLVKYPFYTESTPFSPGDLDIEKIHSNANSELWRVKK